MSSTMTKKQSSAESYRQRKLISEMIKFHDTAYYICPRCNVSLDRDFQSKRQIKRRVASPASM